MSLREKFGSVARVIGAAGALGVAAGVIYENVTPRPHIIEWNNGPVIKRADALDDLKGISESTRDKLLAMQNEQSPLASVRFFTTTNSDGKTECLVGAQNDVTLGLWKIECPD